MLVKTAYRMHLINSVIITIKVRPTGSTKSDEPLTTTDHVEIDMAQVYVATVSPSGNFTSNDQGVPNRGDVRQIYPASAPMGDDEVLKRAREAWISNHRWAPRWVIRRVRAGWVDGRLRVIVSALQDTVRPMTLIVAERDSATAALVLRTSPGLGALAREQREAVAGALHTAIRMGRKG